MYTPVMSRWHFSACQFLEVCGHGLVLGHGVVHPFGDSLLAGVEPKPPPFQLIEGMGNRQEAQL